MDCLCTPGNVEISNPRTIPASKWTVFEVDGPAVLVPQEQQSAPIYVSPQEPAADATPIQAGLQLGYGAWLPKKGRYWAFTVTAVKVRQVKIPVLAVVKPLPEGCSLPTSSQASLTTTASTALAANANRRFALIQNTGTTPVRIRMDGTNPTTSVGIRLEPGDSLDISGDELVRNAVLAIAESGTPTLDIIEGT